jgi:hypothetical protein
MSETAIQVDGNFETINAFGSSLLTSTMTLRALETQNTQGQPDYMFSNEVGVDAPGFQNQRARTLFIGFASLNTDVMIWSLQLRPATNLGARVPVGDHSRLRQTLPGRAHAVRMVSPQESVEHLHRSVTT